MADIWGGGSDGLQGGTEPRGDLRAGGPSAPGAGAGAGRRPNAREGRRASSRDIERFGGHAVGYRAWLVSADGQLTSIGVPDHVWTSAKATAECRHGARSQHAGNEHIPPVWECTCGIHAFTSLSDAIGFMGERLVAGVVRGWGRTIHHGDEGWRSEHAEIVALAPVHDGAGIDGHLRAFASRAGTIVTTLAALRVIAGEHGAGEFRSATR